jgi:ferrous iron transport protein B
MIQRPEPGDAATASPPRPPRVAVAGNPNTGKTSIFNRLTGRNARVGNYPGITVETQLGDMQIERHGRREHIEVLDIPGCYSLSARSPEERIAIDSILGWNGRRTPDCVVIVLDGSQLVRNLYLVLQCVEFGVPCVLALNMIDEIGETGSQAQRVAQMFGVPCVPTSARTGSGIEALRIAIGHAIDAPPPNAIDVPYRAALRRTAAGVGAVLPADWPRGRRPEQPTIPLALWALTSLDEEDEFADVPQPVRDTVYHARQSYENDIETDIIQARYAFLEKGLSEDRVEKRHQRRTMRLDRILLSPVTGFASFLAIMFVVFQSLFAWADPMIGLIEKAFGMLAAGMASVLPASLLRDLLVDGIIGGVGNVLVFLPQILLLFFFIGLLEDSGYMARVAYLMDRIMRALGLHGRAFVPLLSGFACAIPAILATRTMERKRDRFLTMLVIPLMTCSARLPVYTLIIGALFPPSKVFGLVPVQGFLMVAMYVFSTVIALTAAAVLGRTVLRGPSVPLVLELPPYRMPILSTVVRMMWMRTRAFLREAGTIILACTIVLWALLSFPRPEPLPQTASPQQQSTWHAEATQNSIAGRLGHVLEPVIAPLGFDWKIGVGLIGAFAAREVFVSTMGVIYGAGEGADEQSMALRDHMRAETRADGSPVYSPLVGLSLMVFFALACQCLSTLAVVRRETHGWRWPLFLFVYMTVLAWSASFLVYQGGRLLGFA